MNFKKAFIKVGNQEASVNANNSEMSANIELELPQGKTELLAWFELADGTLTNAFYINVENSNK